MANYKRTTKMFSDKGLKAVKDLERVLGQKVTVSIGAPENGGITHYYTSKLPPLVVDTQNARRKIKVEVSSVDQDNRELLHYLFRKTVEG